MSGNKARIDIVLIQTVGAQCKCQLVSIRKHDFYMKNSEVCIQIDSMPASLSIQDQVTKYTTKNGIIGLKM